jgi:hypothetical protein
MAGIGAWIAAMEDSCLRENPGLDAVLDGFLLGDPAGLLQWGEGESITMELSTRFKKPLSLHGRVGHSLAPAPEVTFTS